MIDMPTDATQPSDSPERVAYMPPRFWWLKRAGAAAIVLVVGLIGLAVAANRITANQLQALIDGYQAAGEQIYPEDFNVDLEIPDDQNAAEFYKKAVAAWTWPVELDVEITFDDFDDSEFREEHEAELSRILEANLQTLDLWLQGTRQEHADWKIRLASPLGFQVMASAPHRKLGKFTMMVARRRAEAGDCSGAMELIEAQKRYAEHLDEAPGSTVGHLVMVSIYAKATAVVEPILPILRIQSEGMACRDGEVSVDSLRSMIEMFAHGSWMDGRWRRAMHGERALVLDYAKQIPLPGKRAGLDYLAKPLWNLDTARCLRYISSLAYADGASSYTGALLLSDSTRIYESEGEVWPAATRPVSSVILAAYERAWCLHYRFIAHRRMAGVALAIRWYQTETGALPRTLSDLVPRYISEIPSDPFDWDGYGLGYIPEREHPRLYSIDINRVDDNGTWERHKTGKYAGDLMDHVFFLDGAHPELRKRK